MTDIVERLRVNPGKNGQEGADEIERLRAELAAMTEYADKRNTAALDAEQQLSAINGQEPVVWLDLNKFSSASGMAYATNFKATNLQTPLYALPVADTAVDKSWERFEAELARLSADKDAERYRLLRRGQHWSVINGIGDDLRAEELDAAIDAAMAKGE